LVAQIENAAVNEQPANGFDFSVPSAATIAPAIDTLFFTLVALSLLVTLVIGCTIVYFCIKYRAGSNASREDAHASRLNLEDIWIGVPLVLFFGVFIWSAILFVRIYTPPPNALDIFVVGKQWMWKIEHKTGRQEINEVHVPLGVPVRLVMTSQDVIHAFFVPAFRLKQDVLPGRYSALWFQATKLGVYPLSCSEFCGTDHSRMGGTVIVMPPEDYERWASEKPSAVEETPKP
jgi:cytochrome c oxidase subunit II